MLAGMLNRAVPPVAFVLVACSSTPTAPAVPPPEVLVMEVTPRDVEVPIDFVGTLDGYVNADIRARVPGFLQTQDFKEGTAVKAGHVLFTIDPTLAQARVTQATGDLQQARAAAFKADTDLGRLRPGAASGTVSQQDLTHGEAAKLAADAQVVAAQGALQSANANLGYARVTSPIDGVVGIARVRVGNLVGQGEPTLLTTVSQLDPMRVSFTLSETQYISAATKLQHIDDYNKDHAEGYLDLLLADGSAYARRGKLALVDRQIDPQTGTITLQALFPNPDGVLRPGQYAKIHFVRDTRKGVVALPQRAVRELQGTFQVAVVGKDDTIEIRNVAAGDRVGPLWIIDRGISPGDRVVVEGLQKVRPGIQVTVKPSPAPAPPGGR
jgi:membrane fusion protein (multidrug efflux system)